MLDHSGKILRIVRESKKMSRAMIADKEISQSQISRFENGETTLTINKFLLLLQNMSVTLDEFQSIADNYNMSEEFSFREELKTAYDERNIKLLSEMITFWEEKSIKNPQKMHLKINAIVVKTVLSHILIKFRIGRNEVEYIKEYLLNVEEWGRYEFWVLGNTVSIFKDSELKMLGRAAVEKDKFYQNIMLNKRIAIRTFLNFTAIWLERNDLSQALRYINYLEAMTINVDFLYEKVMMNYNKGWYYYKAGHESGKIKMHESADFLEKYGFSGLAKNLREEIKNL
ncbi:helix-turn-helix domain-containing protein [Lactococcus hircilactis]|uniref:Helix-turn-helix domain-containing protein n=2 Tax=Lactococcus hircilactis TaxID=1494462 RepID=A0A7X1ZA55_9LACT|nr:Rgg/GadR/MutR family transcriptional regulator [Lactococcus hircilactis]MQW39315.1 helix-turn-helix domain-containing protein [Lactococcus hircilactis]